MRGENGGNERPFSQRCVPVLINMGIIQYEVNFTILKIHSITKMLFLKDTLLV